MHTHLWQTIVNHPQFFAMLTIPFVTAVVTWGHVWMALKMLFYPIGFLGIPIKNFPGGGIGWQGIIPRKAGKISGVIVDQALSKLGSLDEFFQAMHPEEVSEYISGAMNDNLENLIDEIMNERSASLWGSLPYALKRRIYAYGHEQLPDVMKQLVIELAYNVENLVDMREMIVNKMESDRALMVRMFLKVGQKEIDFIWHISALIGFLFGIVQMVVFWFVPYHWTVPFFASIWGFLTNWIAIWMVFNPVEPHYVRYPKFFSLSKKMPFIHLQKPHMGVFNWQGGFMKRQEEVSDVFANIVVNDLVTLKNIMQEMMYGSRSAQTRSLIKEHINPILESQVIQTTLKYGLGRKEFGQLKHTIVDKSIEATMIPMSNPELNESRANKIFGMFKQRILALTPNEFQNLLRPAFREDEMTLIVLGGATGFLAGWLHLMAVF
ncbi:hypothetical protein MOMA_08436 [Moraxella macacae 0408225]|uniref:DUF445 domain-containing protein n=1 Tax=Moraxella macacae 0408225 TaxID=1230338 RepID=L2F6R5_9GAMM|nr:hypothetical protein [Moraxella macacae]ELA08575.1 hypothetical protein MOMA_08436 [Moraxella macacae 0408225]